MSGTYINVSCVRAALSLSEVEIWTKIQAWGGIAKLFCFLDSDYMVGEEGVK